jgi:hypothetical protein
MARRHAALVAAAIACAAAVPSAAWASWQTGGPGSAAARAGTLTAPTPTLGTPACAGKGANTTATVQVSWTATAGAAGYDLQWDTSPPTTQPPTTVAGTSAPVTFNAKSPQTLYARLRARNAGWLTGYGVTVTRSVSC